MRAEEFVLLDTYRRAGWKVGLHDDQDSKSLWVCNMHFQTKEVNYSTTQRGKTPEEAIANAEKSIPAEFRL